MRIADFLFFAPGLPFSQLDLASPKLGQYWQQRIEGFYLTPAAQLATAGHTFAAGLLAVAAIDALSSYDAAPRRVGRRIVGKEFTEFAQQELPSFTSTEAASDLYDRFRNGLVHEARLKDGAEFSLEEASTVSRYGEVVRINPIGLLSELRGALERFVALTTADEVARRQFAELLQADFAYELTEQRSRRAAS